MATVHEERLKSGYYGSPTEQADQKKRARAFAVGAAKAVTTDLPGFLIDVVDKIAGDTKYLGEKNRSAQMFEALTGVKSDGSGEETVGGMLNPGSIVKAIIAPAFLLKNTSKYNAAVKAISRGDDSASVYARTGVYLGPADNEFKAAISDEPAKLITGPGSLVQRENQTISARFPAVNYGIGWNKEGRLDEVLDHPQLFAALPGIEAVTVRNQFGGFKSASFSPSENTIRMGKQTSEKEFLSVLLHEVQHAVQNNFGMASGGNPDMFQGVSAGAVKAAGARLKQMQDTMFKNLEKSQPKAARAGWGYDPNTSEFKLHEMVKDARAKLSAMESAKYDNYLNIAGEAEARAVQKMFETRNYTAFPLDLYDVPVKSLIFEPKSVPKVDDNPVIRAILQQVLRPTTKP